MALTLLGDVVVYDTFVRTGYLQKLTDVFRIFNNGSAGCIRSRSNDIKGTVRSENFFKNFGVVSRRDPETNEPQTATKIEMDEHKQFKYFRKFEPVEITDVAFEVAGNDPKLFYKMFGEMLAEKKVLDSVSTAFASLCGAISSDVSLIHDCSAVGSGDTLGWLKTVDLIHGIKPFGDKASAIKCFIMHSTPFFQLMLEQQAAQIIGEIGDMIMYGGTPATFGRPVIVIDDPSLTYTVEEVVYFRTYGLTNQAIEVNDNGATKILGSVVGGNENIGQVAQGEWTMNSGVKGVQFDSTIGVNATNAQLLDSTKWSRWVATKKETAGTLIISRM